MNRLFGEIDWWDRLLLSAGWKLMKHALQGMWSTLFSGSELLHFFRAERGALGSARGRFLIFQSSCQFRYVPVRLIMSFSIKSFGT